MKNTTSEEDGKRTLFLAILITIIVVTAFFVPMPPEEVPVLDEPIVVPHLIEEAEAAAEPQIVLIATTSNQVKEETKKVVDKSGDYYEQLTDNIINCESSWRNIEIVDTNGKWSRGVAMFQDSTWDWLSGLAGVTGSSTEPEKAREVLLWSLKNGYGEEWYTCYHKNK